MYSGLNGVIICWNPTPSSTGKNTSGVYSPHWNWLSTFSIFVNNVDESLQPFLKGLLLQDLQYCLFYQFTGVMNCSNRELNCCSWKHTTAANTVTDTRCQGLRTEEARRRGRTIEMRLKISVIKGQINPVSRSAGDCLGWRKICEWKQDAAKFSRIINITWSKWQFVFFF